MRKNRRIQNARRLRCSFGRQNWSASRKPESRKNKLTPRLPKPSMISYPGKCGWVESDQQWCSTTIAAAIPRSASMPGSQPILAKPVTEGAGAPLADPSF